MAGGNLGDLFISLGIKDEMSKTLQKIVKGMNGVDQATQDAKKRGEELVASLNSINGNNFSKIFREANEYIEKNTKGVANIAKILKGSGINDTNILTGKFLGAGNLAKIASLFGTINSELQRMSKNEDDADRVKAWQNRISNALAYIKLLQDINIQEKKISNTKAENPNVDTKSLDNAKKSLNELRESIISLIHSGGVDDSNILSSLTKVLGMAKKDVQDIISTFKKDNPLSAFTGGAAKVEADIARVTEKLAKMRDLMSEGTQKGYSTSMLTGSISELDNILTRLNAAKLNPTMLTDAAQMRNLISDVLVEMTKATAATQAYGREKGKVIAQERTINEALKKYEDAQSAEYTRKQRQQSQYLDQLNKEGLALQKNAEIRERIASQQEKAWQKVSRSGFRGGLYATPGRSEAAQGYLDIANAYKKAADELQTKHNDANSKLSKLLDEYNKEVKELESKIKAISPKMDGLAWNGKKLSPTDLAKYEDLVKQLEHLKNTKGADVVFDQAKLTAEEAKIQRLINLVNEYGKLAEKASMGTYKPYDATSYEQRRISETAALKNAILERYKAEEDAEKKRKKDEADANREAKANEKQRQTEIKNTERRYDSLGNKIRQLRSEYSRGISFGADVSKTEAEIHRLISIMRQLQNIKDNLSSPIGWKGYLGQLGNIGSGHDTTLASRVLQDQKAVNREVQKGIELEQKRQQAIVDSGAKIQSQLVRGFERANSHAGKLNSTVQDLKSLFLQGGLVFGAQQFAMSIITTGGEMEKQHIALQSILGDMQNANTMFNQIKELALNSPFTFSELNRDVKQLAAYGVEYDQLYDTTKRLADMSSGLGVSFDRIALAFGQVQARGWLDGKELRQIAYAGIPLLDKLSKFYSKQEGRNVSTSEIKTRISNREVSFDDVKSIFWQMTDAGGQFYNMQQVLSETLLGRYNKLKDAWEIMLADFADGKSVIGGTFKFILDQVTNLVQLMHTFSPVVLGAMSGFAMKRVGTLLAGSAASNFLTNKEKIAQDIKARALSGQQLSVVEQRILATKKQITKEDLQTLITAKAITKTELQRLYLSGKISKEMYKQAMAQAGMNTFWTNFANKGGVAISLLGKSLGSMVSSLWAMIGGLPGLILTAVTMGIGYAVSKYQELSRAIEQSQSELEDRLKQIRDFRIDNSSGMAKALADGDTKEIDNLIESYKEKLKELAPYNFNNLVMKADEKKSHEERLKYLDLELQKLQEAEKLAKSKLNVRSNYGDLKDAIDYANIFYDDKDKLTYKYISDGIDKNIARQKAFSVDKYAEFNANRIKERIQEIFGDISKDDTLRLAAEQAMSSVFSTLGISEDRANEIRASVLQAFGIGNKDSWLQGEVRTKMQALIDETFPEIGAKIRASIPLTQAEQDKVKELMDDAKQGLVRQYPELEKTLQGMLANSNFQAVIKLVFATDDKFNNMTSELIGRIPDNLNGLATQDIAAKYRSFAKKWGKDDSWYGGRNAAKSDIDAAYNEYQSAVKSKSKDANSKRDAWILVRDAAKALLYYDYTGEGKKSNKPGKKNKGGHKEDEQLKDLKTRISLYKKMYAEIKKFRDLYGDGALGQLANDGEFEAIFGDKKRFPISDYTNYETSIKELLQTLPASTKDRLDYAANEKAGIQTESRKLLEDQRRDELNVLNKQLDTISEQYETYKKIYELTGNKKGSENIAFGGTVQFDTYKRFLEEQLDIAVKHDNVQSGLNLTTDEVKGMSLENVKDKYGEETRVYDIRKKLEDENNKIKKETIDLMANLIENNATIAQQIEDENRKYERQLELIKGIEDPQMRERASEGATKAHNENVAKLQFEQFKQESDWVAIFDDLDRVSSATINTMINNIDEFSRTTGLSIEVVKQLRDALDKLRNEKIDRNPLPSVFGGVRRGNAIGDILKSNKKIGASGINISDAQAKKTGLIAGKWYSNADLENSKKGAYNDSSKAITSLSGKMQALSNIMDPVINMFEALGEQNSILGQIAGGASNAFSAAANVSGGLSALGLESAGPYGAAAAAALSVGSSLIKAFGADYSSYEKAKAEYDNLTSIWDSLISKKTEYMNIHWGTEATEASKEAQEMLKAEIEQTKIVAQKRLNSGSSAGSHSIWYRMWKGSYKYNGQNWRDVAGEISSKYGVQFNGMEDLLNMNADTLSEIKKNYIGLWSSMDSDFREYLEKLIQYGEKADDMIEALTEKLTGNKFSDLVSSWGDAMSTMANGYEDLLDGFEGKLKNTILNSMVENIYGDKIKALLKKTQGYAENGDKIKDSGGNVISEYTGAEYTDVKNTTEDLAKQIEATRDYLKKVYGWSDNSSSSSRNSVKGITEEEADLGLSYLNAIRLDCSVIRAEQAKYYPEMSEIAKSQLTQLNAIARNTLRNADAAERIDATVSELNDNFNRVLNGTKSLKMK
nr:MAG TPA: Tape measure domain protein [Bacteriophage sp.]